MAIAESISKDIIIQDTPKKYSLDLINRLNDPLLKWNVYPALNFKNRVYGNITATNQTLYMCDDALCFPTRFSGYLSWFDPSSGVGGRVFDKGEAWDHANETNPNTNAPYNGQVDWMIGYKSYWVGVPLTDGTNKVQINIIRRYVDNSILIFNTGKDGTTNINMTVRVYDPPSALGYAVDTNGTRGSGYTDIAPGQYVLFYAGTKPSVDTANGVFANSPMGSSKSLDYELFTNATSYNNINVPKMYLGIRAPSDFETTSATAYIRIKGRTGRTHIWTQNMNRGGINVCGYISEFEIGTRLDIYSQDPYVSEGTWDAGEVAFKIWSGWAEDDSGKVKFIIYGAIGVKHNSKWEKQARYFGYIIYDVDRDEEYQVVGVKPYIATYSYGQAGAVKNPFTWSITTDPNVVKLGYIDQNGNYTTTTTPASITWTYTNNIYGACHYYSDAIVCVEGLALFTDDPNISISNIKSAWSISRLSGNISAEGLRIMPFQDIYLQPDKIYLAVVRSKQLPSNTSDSSIVAWFNSITPVVLTSTDISGMLSVLPLSAWMFGQNTDQISITAPSSAVVGSNINIQISAPNRPNKSVWVAIVDANGNVVAKGSGTLDSSGNATITLTAPSNTGTYRIVAIVAGDRTLP